LQPATQLTSALHFTRPTDGDRPAICLLVSLASASAPAELLFLYPPPIPSPTPPVSVCLERESEGGRKKSSRSREQLNSTGRGLRKGEAWCEGEEAEPATSTAAGGRAVREASSPPCIWIRRPRAAAATASCSHRLRVEIPHGPGCSSSFLGKEAFCLLGRVARSLALSCTRRIRSVHL